MSFVVSYHKTGLGKLPLTVSPLEDAPDVGHVRAQTGLQAMYFLQVRLIYLR